MCRERARPAACLCDRVSEATAISPNHLLGLTPSAACTDLNGSPVTNLATYQAAVAQLRTAKGHDRTPATLAQWANPPKGGTYYGNLLNADMSDPAGNSIYAQVRARLPRGSQLSPAAASPLSLGCGVVS